MSRWKNVAMRPGLEQELLAKIRRLARRQAYAWGGLGALACGGLVWLSNYTIAALAATGSYQYLSLIFSDAGTLASHWYEFSLALIESLPITEIALSLFVLLVLLWSIDKVFKNIWMQNKFQRSYSGL